MKLEAGATNQKVRYGWLPVKDAHRFREVHPRLVKFYPFELKRMYNNYDIIKAVSSGDLIGVEYLLNQEPKFYEDARAYHYALTYSHLRIIKFLVDKPGCAIDHHAISLVIDNAHRVSHDVTLEILNYFISRGFHIDERCVADVVQNGNLKLLKYLVESDLINPNIDNMRYPLYVAVRVKNLKIIEYLVAHGANVDYSHLLDVAISTRAMDIVKYILHALIAMDKVLDSVISDRNMDRVLNSAIYHRNIDVIEYIVKYRTNDFALDMALKFAAHLGHIDIVKCLISDRAIYGDYYFLGIIINPYLLEIHQYLGNYEGGIYAYKNPCLIIKDNPVLMMRILDYLIINKDKV